MAVIKRLNLVDTREDRYCCLCVLLGGFFFLLFTLLFYFYINSFFLVGFLAADVRETYVGPCVVAAVSRVCSYGPLLFCVSCERACLSASLLNLLLGTTNPHSFAGQ